MPVSSGLPAASGRTHDGCRRSNETPRRKRRRSWRKNGRSAFGIVKTNWRCGSLSRTSFVRCSAKEDCSFATTGWAQIETLARERVPYLRLRERSRTERKRDSLLHVKGSQCFILRRTQGVTPLQILLTICKRNHATEVHEENECRDDPTIAVISPVHRSSR
jgi:hypothetical protein